jgi:large subunit ribosomal protein L25
MAEAVVLNLSKREGMGKKAARKIRKQGLLPAVVYGHKEETLSVTLPTDDLVKAVRHGARVFDLVAGGKTEKAIINELQWDHLGKELLHVDFKRVAADERITVTVRLELRGIAPGVTGGGVLDQPLHNLTVECLAVDIPGSIRVNIGELQLGEAIHVRDLKLPEGVVVKSDQDAIVVHVTTPQAEPEPTAAPAGEAAERAEPERIAPERAKEEEEKE